MPASASLHPGLHLGGAYPLGLAFMGLVLLVGILVLSRQDALPFSASVFYVAAGVLGGFGLSALGVDRPDPLRDHELFERVTEFALVIAVFGSGLAVERTVRRWSIRLVAVLLAGVMPACVALVAGFGAAAMGLPFAAAVLLGAVLAPTDPVLAGDVGLGAPGDPEVGEPRFSLHTEAGANDGLASPFVVLGLLLAGSRHGDWLGSWIGIDLLYRTGVAVALGVLGGVAGASAIARLRDRELFAADLDGFLALAVALVLYGVCVALGGYGLVAVFTAGIAFRRQVPDDAFHARVHLGSERLGRLLELAVLVLLGAALTSSGLGAPGLAGWLLAPLLILVIRPALVLLACRGTPLSWRGRLFLGGFGVRGVAAVYYAVVVAGAHVLPAGTARVVVWTTLVCVVVSVVGHGIAATPLSRRWL